MAKVKITKELTPARLRCVAGTCPAVYALSDGDLLIVGKQLSSELFQDIAHRVAQDEFAVKLSPQFFEALLSPSENKE